MLAGMRIAVDLLVTARTSGFTNVLSGFCFERVIRAVTPGTSQCGVGLGLFPSNQWARLSSQKDSTSVPAFIVGRKTSRASAGSPD